MKLYSHSLSRRKNVRRGYIAAACLWAAAIVPFVLAAVWPRLFSGWFPAWSRAAGMVMSYATGLVPFSVCELLIAATAVAGVIYWIRAIRKAIKKEPRAIARAGAVTLVWAGAAGALFIWLWGLNYLLPGPSERMGFKREPYDVITLYRAACVIRDEMVQASEAVPRDGEMRMIPPSFKEARDGVAAANKLFAEDYNFLMPNAAKVKRITFWPLQSYTGVSGIYMPWTAESSVNPDTPWPNIAFTMAHETAHRHGAAAEDEANFIAWLICSASDDACIRYSGAFVAFIHISNALGAVDSLRTFALWEGLYDGGVRADMGRVTVHYEKYEEAFGGVISDAGEAINDTYLKAMGQPEGVGSYGMVADLLVAALKAQGRI